MLTSRTFWKHFPFGFLCKKAKQPSKTLYANKYLNPCQIWDKVRFESKFSNEISKLITTKIHLPPSCQNYALSMKSLLRWYQIWRQIIFKREKESLASSLLNIICRQNWYQCKSDYMDRALVCPVSGSPWQGPQHEP